MTEQHILRQQMISRLIRKLECGLSRQPLDMDFLLFTCRQELYLWEALSRHVNIHLEIVQALQEFLRLVMDHIDHANVAVTTVETVTGARGRPMYVVEKERLVELLELNLPVKSIAKLLGISARTVHRRMTEYGLSVNQNYSTLTDEELDDAIQQIQSEIPTAGYRMVKGRLRSMGINVQWRRLTASMHRVDSLGILSRLSGLGCIVRRTYSVRGPLSLWHVDTNHKLIRYNIVLFGAVDGYSRKVMCLEAATNNTASTAFAAFKKATEIHGIPSRVRGDQGVENVDIARYMFTIRGTDRGSFMSGKSVHNQRIERLWRDVRTCVTSKYYNELHLLEMEDLLEVSSCEDLFAVHLTFLVKLQKDLDAFVEGWNHHPIRTEENRTPEQLWQTGMMLQPINQPENLEDIQEPDIDWDIAADFREDVHGAVVVPEFDCPVTEDQLVECQNLINNNSDLDSRSLYLMCREYLSTLNV
ncbi:uncharacterized protein LOC121638006 isoform X2 [Melanotaenia boesemani]|uniref:uncharacterized protein LOC121638006 isoform X2 n=1 Tax=Melanotaenia boesemani TaxID=1250792 RepID=UPI001C043662|nr:uncharacterized protein LOC121638006 isoform X2 [Melanotaenia boesemani]